MEESKEKKLENEEMNDISTFTIPYNLEKSEKNFR